MTTQPALPIIKPAVVEVAGLQLESRLAELRAQGVHVESMERVEAGLWRLRLVWRDQHLPASGQKVSADNAISCSQFQP